jgi:hypothetical protein
MGDGSSGGAELLYAAVARVGNVHIACGIYGNISWRTELPITASSSAANLDERARGTELLYPTIT